MKEFKQLLDENNINFKFITPPHTELYNEMISNKLKEDIRTFFDKLDMHNEYIDFNSFVQYNDSCFIDPDHLSDIGAERFMKDIDSVLRNMGI